MARQAARHSFLVTPPCEGVAPLGAPSQRRYGAGPRFLTFRFASPPALSCDPFWVAASFEPRASLAARRQRAPRRGSECPRRQVYAVCASLTALRNPGAARVQEERSSPA